VDPTPHSAPVVVWMDLHSEVQASYNAHSLVCNDFQLQLPWQQERPADDDGQHTSAKRRKLTPVGAQPSSAGELRHHAIIAHLEAVLLTQEAHKDAAKDKLGPTTSSANADSSCTHATTDWVSLSHLAHIVKPKLSFCDDPHQHSNLYGTIIRNNADHDRVAAAHETLVLLPAHSAFVMSDISQLSRLTTGDKPGLLPALVT
jgi:hypothetical protein